jgi:uncharacterized protein
VSDEPGQQAVIDALSRPAIYGLPSSTRIERSETHGAIVFLAGDHAYKLKRAVKYPYLDYSTPQRRRDACRTELAINRRTAAELYLAVKAVIREGDALRLVDDADQGQALDWVLVMRRFGEDDLLERMRAAGRFTPELMRSLAEVIADFHDKAEPRPDFGGVEDMGAIVDGNLEQIRRMGHVFDPARAEALARLSRAALERVGPLLDRRRAEGRVRRCHGDLHLNNICLWQGWPVLFDALEFDESFASIDVLYDLAFLLMDLDRHGLRGFANLVLNRYLERGGDYGGLAVLPLFLSCRAAIRAHVTVTRAAAMHAALDEGGVRRLLDQAIRYLEPAPVRLVVVAGLSGTGKSTVSRAVAPSLGVAPGAVILRSDISRKRMRGVDETTKLPADAYTPAMNDRVFAALAETATALLEAGHSVIVDAVYGDPVYRAALAAAAGKAGVRLRGFWLEAPEQVLASRIASRHGDASDATVDVLRSQMQHITPPADWTHIDAVRPVDQIAADILSRLS